MNCGNCHKCLEGAKNASGLPVAMGRMIVCPICGNKRCPHATDHELACTNSNEQHQIGSIYSDVNFKTLEE